jgi:hypothetical protein
MGWAVLFWLVSGPASAADDYESELLRKFKKQNQKSAQQVKETVEENIARALAISPQEPEKALTLLRESKALLDESDKMPRAQRVVLASQLENGFRDARARLESKQQAAMAAAMTAARASAREVERQAKLAKNATILPSAADDPKSKVKVSPFGVTSTAAMDATPVVGPGRRWVRIGGSFGFSGLTGVRLIPIQRLIRNVVDGPAGRFIIIP